MILFSREKEDVWLEKVLFGRRYIKQPMTELDQKGWGNIHHAAYRGFLKAVKVFIEKDPEILELETGDGLNSTPLLLAVLVDRQDMVELLLSLGAKIDAVDSQKHGAVELCALKKHIDLLKYFMKLNHEDLPVWKNLMKFMTADVDEDAEAAGKTLYILTKPEEEERKFRLAEIIIYIPHLEEVIENGTYIILLCVTLPKK